MPSPRLLPLLLLLLSACAPSEPTSTASPGASWLGEGEAVLPWHPSVVRARHARFEGDVTEADPDGLTLRLFDDTVVTVSRTSLRTGALGRSWIGTVGSSSEELGQAVLTVVDGMPVGTVRTPVGLFQLAGIDPQTLLVIERDERAIEPEGPIVTPSFEAAGSAPPPASIAAPPAAGDASTTVDLLVVYTPQALVGSGSQAAMDAVIELAVQETNLGYEASDVDVELRVVHRAETVYDESGFDWSDTLSRLRGTSDGFMDEIHGLRDAYGADHVVLLVDTVGPYAGIGYQLINGTAPFFDAWAFSVVARDYATGAYTFGHELGHNMGANHDHDHAQGPGYFADSHGLQVPTHGYRTIMAYSCDGCARINHWSNPTVTAVGAPTGVVGLADNARTLNQTALLTSQFRAPVNQPTAASLHAPTDGSTLASTVVTFAWDDTGASMHRLQIGTAAEAGRYHDVLLGGQTEATVAGLPHDGSEVVAHLWSLLPSGWADDSASYEAYAAPVGTATITYPPPGTTLPAGSVDIRWSFDGEASAHHLVIFDDDGDELVTVQTPSQAATLTLPCDGRDVHLTLFSERSDGWAESAATYASTACP